jgi:hypothetical protein
MTITVALSTGFGSSEVISKVDMFLVFTEGNGGSGGKGGGVRNGWLTIAGLVPFVVSVGVSETK